MSLWIIFTVAAAALQTTRFVLQKRLAATRLSTAGATFSRFLFAAPVAWAVTAAAFVATGIGLHWPPASFWLAVLVGGLAQIIATDLVVRLFALRNFAVGVAFTKTEVVQTALFASLFLGEYLAATAWVAIGVGLAGVALISRSPEPGARFFGRAAAMGVLSGGLFGVSSVCYRAATLALEPGPFFVRAAAALAIATTIQSLAMLVWLQVREPGEVRRVLSGWRTTALVGLTGMLGSLGWFTAFALQNVAYVRALGQIEMVFTLFASVLLFRERLKPREVVGIVLIVGSLVALVLTSR